LNKKTEHFYSSGLRWLPRFFPRNYLAFKIKTDLRYVLLTGGLLEVESVRFCLSCDTTKAETKCHHQTKKCTKCSVTKMEKCQESSDICIATWTFTKQAMVTMAGCFPLPPHSSRLAMKIKYNIWQRYLVSLGLWPYTS